MRGASMLDFLALQGNMDFRSFVSFGQRASALEDGPEGWPRELLTKATPIRLPARQPLILLSLTDYWVVVPVTDWLTGCASARTMRAVLNELRFPEHICRLGLDRFRVINDVHGMEAGNAVLISVADRLRPVVADRGTVFRTGGDEFVVLLPGLDSEQSEGLLAELLTAVAEPITLSAEESIEGSESVTISATGGMTVFVPGSPEQAFTELGDALWQAKRQGVPYTIYKANGSA